MKRILKKIVFALIAGLILFVLLICLSNFAPTRDLPENLQWETRFNSKADESDKPIGVQKTQDGNLIIVGDSFNGKDFDIFVNKIDGETGELLWNSVYAGGGKHIRSNHDRAKSFVLDESGDIYVNGLTCVGYEHGPLPSENSGSDFDALVFKLSGKEGKILWEKTFDAGRKHSEYGGKIISGREGGHLYLIFDGYDSSSADYRYHVLKIDAESGKKVWWNHETLGRESRGKSFSLAQDSGGHLIVIGTGTKHGEYPRLYLAMLSQTDGSSIWEYRDESEGDFNGYPKAFCIGKKNHIFVMHSGDEHPEVTCIKGETGEITWSAGLDFGSEGGEEGTAMAVDKEGNVIVTGRSQDSTFFPTQIQNWTVKLRADDGGESWRTTPSIFETGKNKAPIFSSQIRPTEIHFDSGDRIVICGTSWNGSDLDFYSTWLNQDGGKESHTVQYDGAAGGHDHFSGAVFHPGNKLVMTGATSNCRPELKGFKRFWYTLRNGNRWDYQREINSFDDDDPYNYDALAFKQR